MMILAAALAIAEAATVAAFLRALASQQRAHARREDLLLNQLLHAVGKPWQEAPADTNRNDERAAWLKAERERRGLVIVAPEQQPIR